MENRSVRNIPNFFTEAMWLLGVCGDKQTSRNGNVVTMIEPCIFKVHRPDERVLFDPLRDANPFFHVMEFCWMMAGRKDVKWIEQFNSGLREYAENDGTIYGAYGYRWRKHFSIDQLLQTANQLNKDPHTRRAVTAMWDAKCDLFYKKDIPCNTHIYWRIVDSYLHMTVCNRSNDAVWGMTGANAVHMTMLQEWMAAMTNQRLGNYYVMTNNLHLYTDLHSELLKRTPVFDPYAAGEVKPLRMFKSAEEALLFLQDVENFVMGLPFTSPWIVDVADPIHDAYLNKHIRKGQIGYIVATDWRKACQEWTERRPSSQESGS